MSKQFEGQSYLSLETYRKSGQAMPTPVWFVEHGGALYVKSESDAGKVKRIRNNPRVRIAPCDARGAVKGDWAEAKATIVPGGPEAERILALWGKKYGLINTLFNIPQKLHKRTWQLIRLDLG